MRAAARGDVEVLHVNQPQAAGPSGLLSQRERRRLFGLGESDRDGPIVPDDPVRLVFDAIDVGSRDDPVQIDGRRCGAEVEALGPCPREPVERRGEHVLPCVLLHVLEAPGPVDPSADRSRGQFPFDHMKDRPVVSIHHIDDGDVAEPAGVERLPSGCRVERGPVEHDGRPPVVRLGADDLRVELRHVRVGVVETFGHAWDLPTRGLDPQNLHQLSQVSGSRPCPRQRAVIKLVT